MCASTPCCDDDCARGISNRSQYSLLPANGHYLGIPETHSNARKLVEAYGVSPKVEDLLLLVKFIKYSRLYFECENKVPIPQIHNRTENSRFQNTRHPPTVGASRERRALF